MIDLETLAMDDDAIIPQIGAVVFDNKTYEIIDEFCECINIMDLKKHGFAKDKDTVQWWSEQDKAIRDSVMNGKKLGVEVAGEFDAFLNKHFEKINFDIWANGILFDIPKIDYFMFYFDFAPLTMRTRYNRVFDFRTLRNITRNNFMDVFTEKESLLDPGAQHNALDDCRWQLGSLKACMDTIANR